MSNHSIIEHRASYYFIRVEEDFLAICSNGKCSPHCKALILSILEHWMNTKREKGEGEYIYLTMPQWIKHMYMLYERNIITACIHELLKEGLIKRRAITVHDQETFEYTLCVDAIHQRIKQLPSKPSKETLPNLDAYLKFKERGKAERAKVKEGVGEKSRTPREKSPRVGEKSTTVREKSTQHRFHTENPNLDSERKNGESQQNPNVTTQERSFTPSSSQSSFSSIELEVRQTYDLICQELYPNCHPNLTTKAIEHFTKLAKSIKTVEDIRSLVAYCRQEQPILTTSKIHPGNLVRWLDGWLQAQPPAPEPEQLVTDSDIAAMVSAWSRLYKDVEHTEAHQLQVSQIQREYGMDNSTFLDVLYNAQDDTEYSGDKSMKSFFRMLERQLRGKGKKASTALV